MGEVFSFKLFITKNIKFMKQYFFMAVATLVVSATAIVGVKAYNHYSMPELMKANLEALTQNDVNGPFYKIAKYELSSRAKITKVGTNMNTNIGIEKGDILSLGDLNAYVGFEIEWEIIDCHKRQCLSTTIEQTIDCIPDRKWVACHSQCNHADNQM